MKTAEIIPRTVIYAFRDRSYRDPERIVVLSTTVHRMSGEEIGPDERAVTLHPAPGETFRRLDYRGVGRGLPVITASVDVTDAELLAAAAALPERLDGPLPKVVGPGVRFHVVRPASVLMPWAEHVKADRLGKQARAAYLREEAALADDEARYRNAVLNLLHRYHVPAEALRITGGTHGEGSMRVDEMDWSDLLKILEDLVAGVTRAAQHDPLRVNDGRWHEVTQTNWEA